MTTCPTGRHPLKGCGSDKVTGPDDEGYYDCHSCGLWFRPNIGIGQGVEITQGSGLHSGKRGVVLDPKVVPTDGRGAPQLAGHYKPMEDADVPVGLDDGELIVIPLNRLRPTNWQQATYGCSVCGRPISGGRYCPDCVDRRHNGPYGDHYGSC